MNKFTLRTTILFKRFRRTPYAVFNSLKRIVNIAVLSVACLTFANAKTLQAQTQQTQPDSIVYVIEEVQILAELNSEQFGHTAGIIQVLKREDIAAAAVENLQDLLRFAGGVDIRQRGANGVQADISIRGSSADQVLVLLNGVNITDVQTGHYNLNIPLDLSAIDRIEILRGSGSRVTGATAFGGAINIVTNEKKKTAVDLGVTAGEYGYIYQNVNASQVTKNTSNTISVSRQRSNGYIENTDFDVTNIYLQSTFNSQETGKLQFQAGFQDKGAGANDFYYFGGYQYDWQRTFFSALSWKKNLPKNLDIRTQAYWRGLHNRFESYRNFRNAPDTYLNHNYHRTDIFGGQIKMERFSSIDRTTIGIDIRNEHIVSNKLGNPLTVLRPVPFAPDSIRFIFGKNRLQANLFTNEIFYLGKFTISGGAALNRSNDYGTNISGGADAVYQAFPNLAFYLDANRTFRFPTYTDLYYTTNESHTSDPNLKPEKATTFEIGAKYAKNNLRTNANIFYRIGTDIIDWMRPFGTDAKWQSTQIDINTLGGDIFVQYDFKGIFLKKAQFSYSFLTQDKTSIEGYDSKYALDYLKHKTVFCLNHKIYKHLQMNWNATWQDRNGDYTLNNRREEYKPFFLLDVRLQWETEKINVFADFNNIFNTKYADFGGIVQPCIWIRTGIFVRL